MRASTLFSLTVAILVGLGVAIAAKMMGYFNPPTAPDRAAEKKPEIQLLVAGHNLFAGDLIDPSFVRVRALKAEEQEHYIKHKDDYLPAVREAVYLRVAQKN